MRRRALPTLRRVEELRALAAGEQAWLRLLGPCLEPLVRSGEWLCVRRSHEDDAGLAPRDNAVVETPQGMNIAMTIRSQSDDHSIALLEAYKFPFRREEVQTVG